LNADGRGELLGEFQGDDKILVIFKNGELELYNFDLSNHFNGEILLVEKFDPKKIMSVIYWDE